MERQKKSRSRSRSKPRLVIVSNRLPVVVSRTESGSWHARPGSGGLVTALAPVLRNRGGVWMGWPGKVNVPEDVAHDILSGATKDAGFTLKPVMLTADERDQFYYGCANEVLWPIFHDFVARCNFEPTYWRAYKQVNRKFARAIAEQMEEGDYIWIHDYHLMNVAKELREMGVVKERIDFFLHTPFPPLDVYLKLPWRFEVLRSLLSYDLIGFQTIRDRRNFINCVRALVTDVKVLGRGQVLELELGDRRVRVGAFPISIDFREFSKLAQSKEVADRAWHIHEQLPDTHIVLGIDRLDYSKGIPERLKAFKNLLLRYSSLHEKVVLVQVVVPSRRTIVEYERLKVEIEQLVSEINGLFTCSGWVPVHYLFQSLDRPELLAYYRTAETALITPLKDGMNLIAKEYCASSLEENCVLILSEFAGAAAQLQNGALLVNPHDVEGVADAIYRSMTMASGEKRRRMGRLRAAVRKQDIYWWVDSFLSAGIAKKLDNFPVIEDYLPQLDLE